MDFPLSVSVVREMNFCQDNLDSFHTKTCLNKFWSQEGHLAAEKVGRFSATFHLMFFCSRFMKLP